MDKVKIKIKNKYFLLKYNVEKQKIKKLAESNTIRELKEKIIGKSINKDNEILLIKLSKEKNYSQPQGSKSNSGSKLFKIGGPIKITFKVYELSKSDNSDDTIQLKPKYEKLTNKKGELDSDKRNGQFLYITLDYYNKNGPLTKTSDLESIGLLAIQYKLEKRPLAPKLIDQIYNLK
jgi:hypothetical protein